MMNRRNFIKTAAAASIAASLPSSMFAKVKNKKSFSVESSSMIWANLIHLSTNMWEDHPYIQWEGVSEEVYKDDFECKTCKDALVWGLRAYRPFLVFDEKVWDAQLKQMSAVGMNMVIIDLGDGIKYNSHPEISVKNAWSVEKLKLQIQKVRALGLEPIPKLNFASSHDAWLGEYSRMLSTKKYYEVCRNLISEVIDIFDNPRFFHLGMDEETAYHQRTYKYMVVRQDDLWWKDFYFLIDEVEKKGVRPWVWSDYGWHHPELFFKKMPKSVLQSNWYYSKNFDFVNPDDLNKKYVNFYNELDKYGYDQVPTGSNYLNDTNIGDTVEYCKKTIDSSRLKGFIAAPWFPTLSTCYDKHMDAINQIREAKKIHY